MTGPYPRSSASHNAAKRSRLLQRHAPGRPGILADSRGKQEPVYPHEFSRKPLIQGRTLDITRRAIIRVWKQESVYPHKFSRKLLIQGRNFDITRRAIIRVWKQEPVYPHAFFSELTVYEKTCEDRQAPVCRAILRQCD